MYIKMLRLLLFLTVAILFSCKPEKDYNLVKFGGQTQGTYYVITYYDHDSTNYQQSIDSIFECVNRSVSLWDSNSIISRINRNDSSVEVDHIFTEIYKISLSVSEKTHGALDVTVGPLVETWGFGPQDSAVLNTRIVDSLMDYIGYKKIRLEGSRLVKDNPSVRIDFNAIAQGYTVDLVSSFLDSKGIDNYLVDIGGEVFARGQKPGNKPWMIGVEKPAENKDAGQELQSVVSIKNQALSTSGNYRKYYLRDGKKLSHTIDPATGYPVSHSLLSVSVLSGQCGLADAYATAFMVMGLEKSKEFLKNNKDLEAYFIYAVENGQYKIFSTPGFEKILEKK